MSLIPIDKSVVQEQLHAHCHTPLYIHLELTMGAYASHFDSSKHPAANFIRNVVIQYSHGSIEGQGPYRVGLKLEHGWVYAEGLTHMVEDEAGRIILSGINSEGKLVVAFQLSKQPF